MNNYIFEAFGEYKIYIAFFLAILFFMKSPSISFFTGLILKLFRINYSDKQYVEYDEKLYNQQLFRLKNGVRVASADDAKLISKALSEGIIERSTLRFTGWFGAVGVKRTMRLESVSTTFFGVLFIFTACSILYDAPYMKAGYVTYNVSDTEKLYISKHRVYDKNNTNSWNKLQCLKIIQDEKSIQHLKDACIYITTDDLDLRTELQDAIESESTGKKVLAALVVALTAIGGLIIVGITNFVKLNKIVCDLKGIK
ncbi:hypothetical protein [Enterobacter cloacae]|uniref:hypothetical protein n=1 Tax=Enterobacter cloacae TaxID=550 RepID=UPI000BA05339|nr:hypothetical protein [Enterobacter cloacae]OZU92931.1 hypothetical protein CIW67_10825 [Enterobacter cloacae]PAN85017.1 hypothetical protein CIW66_11880 [Enterobacter cloacae]PAN97394.1 hypothetical protein CIW63_11245 [Enterobacter cloacae]HAS1027138.1 hypothetical protein [Enterobacter cloacae]HAS1036013.1 hypothetical protein [Enterobacter cloacae]